MITGDFSYQKPQSLAELFDIMQDGSALLAGGTDLLIALRADKISASSVIDIKAIPELKGIYDEDDRVFIGSAETFQAILDSSLLQPYGALIGGVSYIGCYEIRQRATIGGNICNASPSADAVPGLLLYDAEVVVASKKGTRREPLADFLLGNGKVNLAGGEVLQGILLPRTEAGSQSLFFRTSRVKGMDLSGVSVSVYAKDLSDFRIALGAVWPKVDRALAAESLLNSSPYSEELLDQTLEELKAELKPREGSLRATPEYKRAMVDHYIREAIAIMAKGGHHV